MEKIILTPKNYRDWDAFCLESDDTWYYHTSRWLDYNLHYRPDLKSESKSFMVVKDGKIAAICPLILEKANGVREFSFGGGYAPTPALANGLTGRMREKILKEIFEYIDDLAARSNVKRARFRFPVLNKSFIENYIQQANYLTKFGYLDNSILTQVIDLRKTADELKKGLRHGHDYDVSRAANIFHSKIFTKANITKKDFNKYVDLHFKAAGRVTRPRKTFDIMYNSIKDGQAFLVGTKKVRKFVGFSYFTVYKGNAYYGSSCNDPNFKNLPIAHFMQWEAIKFMQSKKYKFYELGWQFFPSSLIFPASEKEKNISKFKRGFGGFLVNLFMGEKFYDKDYFLKIYGNRIEDFSNGLIAK